MINGYNYEIAVQTYVGYSIFEESEEAAKKKLLEFMVNLAAINNRFGFMGANEWSNEEFQSYEDGVYDYRARLFLYYKAVSYNKEYCINELQGFLDDMIKYHSDFSYSADFVQCEFREI